MLHFARLGASPRRSSPLLCVPKHWYTQSPVQNKFFLTGVPLASPENWTGELVNTPVEFTEHGQRKLGLLQRPQGKRWWWLIDEEGNDKRINRYQLSFQWPEIEVKEYSLEELQELIQLVNNTKREILSKWKVVDIWKDLSEGHMFGQEFLTGLSVATYLQEKGVIEQVEAHIIYACHLILAEKTQFFQPTSISGYNCRKVSEVMMMEKRIKEKMAEEEARAHFLNKLRKLLKVLEGSLDPDAEAEVFTDSFDSEHDLKFFKELKEYALEENPNVMTSHVAEKYLVPLGLGQRPHDAFQLLVKMGICGELDNPHVLRWDVDYEAHSQECTEEALRNLDKPPRDEVEHLRVHLEDLPVFTVTNSIDDNKEIGFSAKKEGRENWVYIHIADPTRYMNVDDIITKTAEERGLSVDLPEKFLSMLPKELCKVVSFESGRDDPTCALTVAVKVEKNGRILEYKVFWSYIKNIFNLTFTEADNVMLGKKSTNATTKIIQETLVQQWMDLEQFAERRKKHRLHHDAIDISLPSSDAKVTNVTYRNPDGVEKSRAVIHVDVRPAKLYNSRGILEECLLAAGEACASYGNRWDVSLIYLAQGQIPLELDFAPSNDPLEDRIKQLSLDKLKPEKKGERIIEHIRRLRQVPPEYYTLRKSNYSGKGLVGFASLVSPLKRFVDLVNHFQFKKATLMVDWEINNAHKDDEEIAAVPSPSPAYASSSLVQIMEGFQAKKTEVSLLEENSRKFWILWCIKNEIEEKKFNYFNALVVTARDDRNESLVLIRKYELEAKMVVRRKLVKGDTIKVVVQHVEPFYGRLVLKEYRDDFGIIE